MQEKRRCIRCGKEFDKERKKFHCSEQCKFMQNVKINESTGCWDWQGYISKYGYGYVGRANQPNIQAHRLSYQLFKGEIPEGKFACHTCDRRCCVAPHHLWVGSNSDNMIDATKKKRLPTIFKNGEKHSRTKLDNAIVRKIKEDFVKGLSSWEIAEKYIIALSTIRHIAQKKSWNSVIVDGFDENLVRSMKRRSQQGSANHCSKITEEIVKDIRKMKEKGIRMSIIAETYKISKSLVSLIIRRERWSHIP